MQAYQARHDSHDTMTRMDRFDRWQLLVQMGAADRRRTAGEPDVDLNQLVEAWLIWDTNDLVPCVVRLSDDIYIQMIYVYIWTRYGNMSLPDWLGYLCLGIFLAFTKFSSPTSVAFTGTRYTCGWWACIRHRMERNNGRTSKLCTKFLVLWYRILVYNTGTNANSIRVALTLKVWSTWIIWRRWWTRWLALMASCWVQAEYAWASVRGCSQDKWIEDKIGQDSESKHKCDRKGIRENTQTRAKKIGEALHERRLCATTTFEALQAIYQSSIHGLQQRCCFALRSFAPSLGSRR